MVLSERLHTLRLTAKFRQGVVSKNGTNVSHLTLQTKWNDVPFDENGRLQWWVGEGPNRLALASPLDPNRYAQPTTGRPIFWAVTSKGGALCHYVGHWVCVRFDVLPEAPTQEDKMILKKQGRQALLEFAFVKFDQDLSQNME